MCSTTCYIYTMCQAARSTRKAESLLQTTLGTIIIKELDNEKIKDCFPRIFVVLDEYRKIAHRELLVIIQASACEDISRESSIEDVARSAGNLHWVLVVSIVRAEVDESHLGGCKSTVTVQ